MTSLFLPWALDLFHQTLPWTVSLANLSISSLHPQTLKLQAANNYCLVQFLWIRNPGADGSGSLRRPWLRCRPGLSVVIWDWRIHFRAHSHGCQQVSVPCCLLIRGPSLSSHEVLSPQATWGGSSWPGKWLPLKQPKERDWDRGRVRGRKRETERLRDWETEASVIL